MSNPHDTFFRRMMEHDPVPKEVLRVALPEEGTLPSVRFQAPFETPAARAPQGERSIPM